MKDYSDNLYRITRHVLVQKYILVLFYHFIPKIEVQRSYLLLILGILFLVGTQESFAESDESEEIDPEIEEIIQSIEDNFSYIENLGNVMDEGLIVDYSIYSISELRKMVDQLVDNSIKQELYVILDNTENQLSDAKNFVLAGNEFKANNSISEVQEELTEFISILESEPNQLSDDKAGDLIDFTEKIIEDSKKRDLQVLTIDSEGSTHEVIATLQEISFKSLEENRELFSKLESMGVEISVEVGEIDGNTLSIFDSDLQRTDVIVLSPKKQVEFGVEEKDVTCKEGLQLILKLSDGSPACVKPKTAEKLIERGWAS